MAVPYSITIDTPGYGDIRGVKRGCEITEKILKLLKKQASRDDLIHSACFVAASGDSRLSTTQKYILHSAYTIFGPCNICGPYQLVSCIPDGLIELLTLPEEHITWQGKNAVER